jgi:hypothetical protein
VVALRVVVGGDDVKVVVLVLDRGAAAIRRAGEQLLRGLGEYARDRD